jgi:hypothetical protein
MSYTPMIIDRWCKISEHTQFSGGVFFSKHRHATLHGAKAAEHWTTKDKATNYTYNVMFNSWASNTRIKRGRQKQQQNPLNLCKPQALILIQWSTGHALAMPSTQEGSSRLFPASAPRWCPWVEICIDSSARHYKRNQQPSLAIRIQDIVKTEKTVELRRLQRWVAL